MTPRERLLQAARDVVATDGLEGLTLRAIARHAGVSHGAPLRHFPSLAALLAALAAEGFTGLMATIDAVLDAADDEAVAQGRTLTSRQRVAVAGQAYVRFALAEPGVYSVMFRQERVDVTDEAYQLQGFAAFQQLVDLVAAAQRDGWRPEGDTVELAAVFWANVHGLAELSLHGSLAAVVGPDAAERLPLLSTTLSLGLDPDEGVAPRTARPTAGRIAPAAPGPTAPIATATHPDTTGGQS
jgi:AcrR family transcriptional regulator